MQFGITFEFEKADAEGRYVRGWASVVSVDGVPVVDADGDVVEIEELRKGAHEYILEARVAKAMHRGIQIGDVVESVIVDDAFVKAMGATTNKRGWWIGMAVNERSIQKRVKSGELRSFSIGGRGKRKALT